ncbi:GET complex subunit get1 [Blastocladiella emersonii ATCC 22665]|nr:GET complex subunit get1 [Blastocladiella emersonii ATCC 22665]
MLESLWLPHLLVPAWLASAPPALVVLAGSVFIEVISWLGFTLICEQLFAVYRWLAYRAATAKHAQLRGEIVTLRAELKTLSAMDEFAKWARVRRTLDKAVATHDELASTLRSARSMFLLKAQVATRAVFYLLYVGLSVVYRTTPMFYVPDDWFGGLVGAVLALPFAPAGTLNVLFWMLACRRVTRNAMELVLGDKLDAVPESDSAELATAATADDK